LFQIPVGRVSDLLDRRLVLAALGAGLAALAVALLFLPHSLSVVLPAAALLGGFMSTLYPVCVAHAHDRMPADRVVAVSGALVLMSGIGSVLGPLIGTPLMMRIDIDGVLYLMAAAALLLVLLAVGRSRSVAAAPAQARTFDLLTPQATALARDPAEAAAEPAPAEEAASGYAAGAAQASPAGAGTG